MTPTLRPPPRIQISTPQAAPDRADPFADVHAVTAVQPKPEMRSVQKDPFLDPLPPVLSSRQNRLSNVSSSPSQPRTSVAAVNAIFGPFLRRGGADLSF